jgi:hypothetical protein
MIRPKEQGIQSTSSRKECIMKKIVAIGTVIGTLMVTSISFAAGPIGQRQQIQQQRINQGVRSGTVTKQEMRHLRQDQKAIQAAKNRALKDGYLNRGEKARISRMQNEASRHIQRAKTNNRHLPYRDCRYQKGHQVKVHPRPVPTPCPPSVAVIRPAGFIGISVTQPGWSLAWSTALH